MYARVCEEEHAERIQQDRGQAHAERISRCLILCLMEIMRVLHY